MTNEEKKKIYEEWNSEKFYYNKYLEMGIGIFSNCRKIPYSFHIFRAVFLS